MAVIPLREKMGNYDNNIPTIAFNWVIPLREKMGNYDRPLLAITARPVIPLREKMGNYHLLLMPNFWPVVIPLREKMGNGELRQCLSPQYSVMIPPHIISAFTVFVNPQTERNVLTKIVPGNGCSLPWSSPGRIL